MPKVLFLWAGLMMKGQRLRAESNKPLKWEMEKVSQKCPFRLHWAGCIDVFQVDKSIGVEAPLNIRVQETVVVVLKVSLKSEVERGVADEAGQPESTPWILLLLRWEAWQPSLSSREQLNREAGWRENESREETESLLPLGQRIPSASATMWAWPLLCPRIREN